jgi:hypothetical protein
VSGGDRLTQLSRAPGPTFIEINEVRTTDAERLIYCTGVRGLQVVDASDPEAMKVVHELSSELSHHRFPRCQHVAESGDIVYATNRGDRFQPTPFVTGFDLSVSPPSEVGPFSKPGHTFEGVATRGAWVFAAAHDRGLLVLENSGQTLVERGSLTGLGTAWAVDIAGHYLFVTDAKGALSIVDVANPRRPALVSRVELDGATQAIAVAGDVAFVAAGMNGVIAVDVSDPRTPTVLGETDTGGAAVDLATSNGRLFVANWSDARIYDAADPRSLRLLAVETLQTDEASSRVLGIGARDDIAFIGEWTGLFAHRYRPDRRAPDIRTDESVLEFSRVDAGQSRSRSLTIDNEGDASLHVRSIAAEGDGFSVAPGPLEIGPGRSATIEVHLAATSDDERSGTVILETDDPDEPTVRIGLFANQDGLGVGDRAPEIHLSMIDGGQWRASQQTGQVILLAYFATF